jgi:hypothetical protein
MRGRDKRRWRDLCEEAEAVDDAKKLQKLARQITHILDTEQKRLRNPLRQPKVKRVGKTTIA